MVELLSSKIGVALFGGIALVWFIVWERARAARRQKLESEAKVFRRVAEIAEERKRSHAAVEQMSEQDRLRGVDH